MFRQTLLACILFSILALASSPLHAQLKFESLGYGLTWIWSDSTSVRALIITDQNDALLVDTMYGDYTTEIAEHLEKEKLNLKYIVNTHYHGDHTEGNMQFERTDIIAHENTLKHIQDSSLYGPPKNFRQRDLPNILFVKRMKILLGDTIIDMYHFGPAHTQGDAIVHIPSKNVIAIGDIMLDAKNTLPFIADPKQALAVLDEIVKLSDAETKIVTGHGALASKEDVAHLMQIIKETVVYAKSNKPIASYPESWNTWNSEFLSMKTWLSRLRKRYE